MKASAISLVGDETPLQRIRIIVDAIKRCAGDDESAHDLEDQLHQTVLRYIADADPHNAPELAREALKTLEIEFARWCA